MQTQSGGTPSATGGTGMSAPHFLGNAYPPGMGGPANSSMTAGCMQGYNPISIDVSTMLMQWMQQMQDWMLYQKQEVQMLRKKCEDQQEELHNNSIKISLFQEKLQQQEERMMQHELKLLWAVTNINKKSSSERKDRDRVDQDRDKDKEKKSSSQSQNKKQLQQQQQQQQQKKQRQKSQEQQEQLRQRQRQQQQQQQQQQLQQLSHLSTSDKSATSAVSHESSYPDPTSATASTSSSYPSGVTTPIRTVLLSVRSTVAPNTLSDMALPASIGVGSKAACKPVAAVSEKNTAESQYLNKMTETKTARKDPPKTTTTQRNNKAAAADPYYHKNNYVDPNDEDEPGDYGEDVQGVPIVIDVDGVRTVPLPEEIAIFTQRKTCNGEKIRQNGTSTKNDIKAADLRNIKGKSAIPQGRLYPVVSDQEVEDPDPHTFAGPATMNNNDGEGQSTTEASSTCLDERRNVTNKKLYDPYGNQGVYSGSILKSTAVPHGEGKMVYNEDKQVYQGQWRHGRWHGHGKAFFANGDCYEGVYRFDHRHGNGKYSWSDGRVYDGMFQEDRRHGQGTFKWPDGEIYEGEFSDGKREGNGSFQSGDGSQYIGEWRDGRYNGYGICIWEDGRCYQGEWRDGMSHGKGVETYADGTVRHDGQWANDEPLLE